MEMAVDDDGRSRTGTVWTATAHAITAIVGTGVLTLPWSIAQLGWIIGPIVLVLFAFVTYYCSILLSDCYRSPDPIKGRRNYTYMDAIRAFLGEKDVSLCGIVQYLILWGTMVGYTITACMSMMAIKLSHCYHKNGKSAVCEASGILYGIMFGVVEVILSQFPNLEKVSILSYTAAAMSILYSFIALYLSAIKFSAHQQVRGTVLGVDTGGNISAATKVWHCFQALGNIAFAYTYAMVLIEIQDTLKSPPPENRTMRKANVYGIGGTTIFYIFLGLVGYAAFGSDAPGNILTGFYEPFWLIDIANIAVLIHLIGAYQVFSQPLFAFYEHWLATKWPNSGFFNKVYTFKACFPKSRSFKFTLCKLLVRTTFVILTTVVSLMLPFFNAIVGLLGALGFWPLTVYYPITMYLAQAKIRRGNSKWVALQLMSCICLLVSLVSVVGSIADIAQHLGNTRLFKMEL
ncbi:uncharacterized protein A4U43_C05F10230 [Asparagus officinalis]|uniref:Amino acid transporter transmembrane domain-containing protein n=1 Tax=Asparagus officinalis TaxID=4686 RepID=A0A5P1ER85_ASPOF|nr:uncharacterized protein A4U43_C05F10230 [Asparagus officinalis]